MEVDGNTFVLAVPSTFVKEWIETRYPAQLTGALSQAAGFPVSLVVNTDETLEVRRRAAARTGSGSSASASVLGMPSRHHVSTRSTPSTPS